MVCLLLSHLEDAALSLCVAHSCRYLYWNFKQQLVHHAVLIAIVQTHTMLSLVITVTVLPILIQRMFYLDLAPHT